MKNRRVQIKSNNSKPHNTFRINDIKISSCSFNTISLTKITMIKDQNGSKLPTTTIWSKTWSEVSSISMSSFTRKYSRHTHIMIPCMTSKWIHGYMHVICPAVVMSSFLWRPDVTVWCHRLPPPPTTTTTSPTGNHWTKTTTLAVDVVVVYTLDRVVVVDVV